MSREGRSQPIQPRSSHGFADPGPAAVGTTPQRPTVIERERRRELALTPISINGLYALSLVTVTTPPPPLVVELARRRELPLIPIAINGLYAITLPTVTPPPPLVVEQASARWRAIVAASSSGIQALVAAAFEATVLPPAPTQSVARESVRLPVPQPISQHGPVADIPVPPEPELAVGGRVFAKRPPIRTVTLRPRHATVRVTAYAPRLTITTNPGAGAVRTRTLAPAPTLVFGASAQSTETLGQLPRSKRDLINRLVMYDTATLGDGIQARSLVHEQVPILQLATQSTDELSRSKRDLIDKLVIYDTV